MDLARLLIIVHVFHAKRRFAEHLTKVVGMSSQKMRPKQGDVGFRPILLVEYRAATRQDQPLKAQWAIGKQMPLATSWKTVSPPGSMA